MSLWDFRAVAAIGGLNSDRLESDSYSPSGAAVNLANVTIEWRSREATILRICEGYRLLITGPKIGKKTSPAKSMRSSTSHCINVATCEGKKNPVVSSHVRGLLRLLSNRICRAFR